MKNFNRTLLSTLVTASATLQAAPAFGQTFTTLYNFTGGADGANPFGKTILSSNILFGTTTFAGNFGNGTVFALSVSGTTLTNLHSFTAMVNKTNYDGAGAGDLILSGNTLYGTAIFGGGSGNGTVFSVREDGSGFTNLHSFSATNSNGGKYDGAQPFAGLTLSSNILYGTTTVGGNSGSGALFAIYTDGTGFTNLYSFSALNNHINKDGAQPFGALILAGNTLYGSASFGGNSGDGTVFSVHTDGSSFTNLYNFTATSGGINGDGAFPNGLILAGGTLYGTANGGGSSGNGTVFSLNINGSGFKNLHSFSALDAATQSTNSDGAFPLAGLLSSGDLVYGLTPAGGSSGNGTVFAVSIVSDSFTNLHNFANMNSFGANEDGANPQDSLILANNELYGTAYNGGDSGYGTVFSLSLPEPNIPRLTISSAGTKIILTWPTNLPNFNLQHSTNLVPPISWNLVAPSPTIVNGMNTVTNPASGSFEFYRLIQ